MLGSVKKFEPVSRGGAVDFEMAELALDAIALLVERTAVIDLDAADWPIGNDRVYLTFG